MSRYCGVDTEGEVLLIQISAGDLVLNIRTLQHQEYGKKISVNQNPESESGEGLVSPLPERLKGLFENLEVAKLEFGTGDSKELSSQFGMEEARVRESFVLFKKFSFSKKQKKCFSAVKQPFFTF